MSFIKITRYNRTKTKHRSQDRRLFSVDIHGGVYFTWKKKRNTTHIPTLPWKRGQLILREIFKRKLKEFQNSTWQTLEMWYNDIRKRNQCWFSISRIIVVLQTALTHLATQGLSCPIIASRAVAYRPNIILKSSNSSIHTSSEMT